MAVINVNSNDVDLLARLIRAEAEGEGEQGMLMVGNVGVNRIRSNCLDFQGIHPHHEPNGVSKPGRI